MAWTRWSGSGDVGGIVLAVAAIAAGKIRSGFSQFMNGKKRSAVVAFTRIDDKKIQRPFRHL